MTIELNRAHSPYIFRQNPFNPRIIDYRRNSHGARWKPYQTFDTEQEARAEMWKIESERDNAPKGEQP